MTGFSLTKLPLLSGALALCPLPGGGGQLRADLAQVKAFGAEMVLTLVEPEEREALGCADLPQAVQDLGMAWRQFPIVDFGVPDDDADWAALSSELRAILARGGRLMVHCRGGCGRTGMIALRLMVDTGEEPGAALARLRAVRPCAVETDAQEVWASV